MIAGAGGEGGNLAAALNFQNTPAARAAMAAAQLSAAGMMPHGINGKDSDRYGSDRGDDDGELGSDAENDDMSDNEDIPSSTAVPVTGTLVAGNGESN